jgi:hypothetical protein
MIHHNGHAPDKQRGRHEDGHSMNHATGNNRYLHAHLPRKTAAKRQAELQRVIFS